MTNLRLIVPAALVEHALQLAINLGALVLAGIATLLVEETAFRRRRGRSVKAASRSTPPA